MKTQLIQLDSSDDVISVRDKMGWSQTSRILLVWPEHGQILSRRLDLLLLQRHSTRLGAQLALVTQSPQIKEIAQELQLAVFENTRQAQSTRWRSRRRQARGLRRNPPPDATELRLQHRPAKPGWQETLAGRSLLFGVGMLALLALILVFIPSASITLQPATITQSITLPVTAGPTIGAVNLAGELPVNIQEIVVEGRDSLTTTGNLMIPGEPASGAAQFTNLTQETVRFPPGVIITTLDAIPIRFTTTRAGSAPAGSGRSVTIPIRAMVPGETGNLPANSLAAIEGELGLSLSVTNLYATHGGSEVSAPAPQERDRRALSARLTDTLRNSALAEMQESLVEGDILLTTTLELADTLEETYAPTAGLPGNQLELTLRLEFQVMTISAANLHALIGPVMDGSLPAGYKPVSGSLSITHSAFSTPDASGRVEWNISAQRTLQADIVAEAVIQFVLGQPASTISKRLAANLPLADDPDVELYPSWWSRLPYLPFRIKVILD
jgi:hypothetical protein